MGQEMYTKFQSVQSIREGAGGMVEAGDAHGLRDFIKIHSRGVAA
jgi:hypothetical protein